MIMELDSCYMLQIFTANILGSHTISDGFGCKSVKIKVDQSRVLQYIIEIVVASQ